jgi:predicted TIM-barrel fold metal-dependent hydrolase
MTDPDSPLKSLGNIDFMRRDYLVKDYLDDIGPQNVVGSVFVEAVWDRTRPVDEEVRWVLSLRRPRDIAARCVAWAPLASPDIEAELDKLAALPSIVGVRETIRWHPDPAKRWAQAGILDDPAWRRGAAALTKRGYLLELLMNPYQSDDVARLAADLPDLTIVVNHCGTPIDRDAEGLARWTAGLNAMGRMPNVAIKLSNFPSYGTDKSLEALRATVMTCIDAFAPARALFGTDYPVGRRAMTFQDICGRFKDIAQSFSSAEQRALFHDNTARLYRFDPH